MFANTLMKNSEVNKVTDRALHVEVDCTCMHILNQKNFKIHDKFWTHSNPHQLLDSQQNFFNS